MLKKAKYTYAGMNQDISKSKRDPRFYFDAENIRIYSKDSTSTAAVTNEKGNTHVVSLPANQKILGHAIVQDTLVTFSSDGSTDKITTIELNNYATFELFSGSLNFNSSNLIETEVYIENENTKKIYWVDGLNQLRHINIINKVNNVQTAYTQAQAILFDAVPEVTFSQPYLESVAYGGTHTSGMIQYAYNLISKGGSQSAVSPISELYPLDKLKGGGSVNEVVGKILNIKIDSVDTKYDIIRVYAIKFTSLNVNPTIGVIAEESIGGNSTFTFSDDGRIIRTITSEELLFLGGTAYVPSTITSKFNRLIMGDMKELFFDVNTDTYDTRAYRFPTSSTTTKIKNKDLAYDDVISDSGVMKIQPSVGDSHLVASDHDCINEFADYNAHYKYNSTVVGATGTNIDISITQTSSITDPRDLLKSDEVYRFGIEFYNKRGQTTEPKWICDLKTPKGNLNGQFNTLNVVLRNTTALTAAGVVGWRVLRVERTEQDRTILTQGIANPMVFQNYTNPEYETTTTRGITEADNSKLKVPSPFMRTASNLVESWDSSVYLNKILHGQPIGVRETSNKQDPRGEIYQAGRSETLTQNSYEETRLYQLYSPELIFNTVQPTSSLKYRIVGNVSNTISDCAEWAKQYNTETTFIDNELKREDVASLFNESKSSALFDGNSEFNQNARIGGVGDGTHQNQYQYYRKFTFGSHSTDNELSILDTPLVAGVGESNLLYNNNESKYKISNQLTTLIADRNLDDSNCVGIISVVSDGMSCMLLADSSETKLESRLTTYLNSTTNSTALMEITRTLTNQYGGNTYEARSRNTYLRIGDYKDISQTSINIKRAGDVFMNIFRFARILPSTTIVNDAKYYLMTEIVEVPVETIVDCDNRNDSSISGWDSVFMPSFDKYHSYNSVYSQQPIFNSTTATPFTFEAIEEFPHRLNATKTKVIGELVDSWTDVLINEELYLDGKYGNINRLIRNNDIVYAFQDKGISVIEIEPRVQTVATDGTAIELGKGTVLYNNKYLTTSSGSVNKWAIFSSPAAVYYMDVANKSISRIVGISAPEGLSDKHGIHSYLYSNVDYETLKHSTSVIGAYDQISNDAYFTTPTFTIAFNEATNSFTSRYSFKPKRYISTYYGLFSTLDENSIYKHGIGSVGNFYGTLYPSNITYVFNPEPDGDCVFNNLEFKSEVYNSGADVPKDTLNKIHCWNEYQNTGEKTLTVGNNIYRKYRDWNLYIPRNSTNILERMRGQWLYCKVQYNNTNNYNLVLHDMLVSYDSIQKSS